MASAPGVVEQKIEAYLRELRARFRGMNEVDVREIVEELRAHIADKIAASGEVTPVAVERALAALGTPEELASQYLSDALLSRAEISRSPVGILLSLFRWASKSNAGFAVLLGSIAGYLLGILLILPAVLKPFHPQNAGLWASRDSTGELDLSLQLGLGSGSAPAGRDVLGWWVMPIGLLVGVWLLVLTTRLALWCVRQYRRSRALPRG